MLKLLIILALSYYIEAATDEEIKIEFTKYVVKCTKENSVEMSDLFKLQRYEVPTKNEVKCLLACTYRLAGTLNDKGLFDTDKAIQANEIFMKGNSTRLNNGKKVIEICQKVNEIEVQDGAKGCERAVHIFKCITETAPKYGFKI